MDKMAKRESGTELLRIACIAGIIGLHIYGDFKNQLVGFNRYAAVFYNSLFNIGVSCFVLISGYFGIRRNYVKLRGIHLMMIFYALVSYGIAVWQGGAAGVRELIFCFFPLYTRRHWYLSCYFMLAVLAPYLNFVAQKMERRQLAGLLTVSIAMFDLLPVLPFFSATNDGGKGICQFVILYLTGRYLAAYRKPVRELRRHYFLMAVLMLSVTFGGNVFLSLLAGHAITWLASDACVTILLCAVYVFLFAKTFSFRNKTVNRCASYIVGIYVSEATVRALLDPFVNITRFTESPALIGLVMLYAVGVAVIAGVIEAARAFVLGRPEKWYANAEYRILCRVKTVVSGWLRPRTELR